MRRTRIKICGVTEPGAARAAAEAGADAVGFVFHPESRRFIEPARAWEIIGSLPPFVSTVGLFVNASVERFCDAEEACPTDLSQLHGDEDDDLIRECGPNIIKAVRFEAATIGASLARLDAIDEVAAILIDGSSGGLGTAFDWAALEPHVSKRLPDSKPVIIAGGLTPDNVGEAIRRLRPWAVDVSSAVESTPGRKDPRLIDAFCAAVRRADD